MGAKVEIVEVGPRDGLQTEAQVLPVADRLELIRRLEACGVRRIEAASFVDPRRVPQMAGAEAIMAGLPHEDGRSRIGLALNLKGWERAVEAGVDEVNVVLSASDAFGQRNQGMGVQAQLSMLAEIAGRAHNMAGSVRGRSLSATISVAFGCPFEGEVSEARVLDIAHEAARLGIGEIALADTLGVADPWTVRSRVEAVKAATPDARLRFHAHDTRGTGLANVFAALEAGAEVLDASCGGLGGCPFAPGATGNIAAEDLVYMLERGGFDTGLDLDGLIETARWVCEKLGKPPASALSRAGGFPR
jgi:hydroxymethylglutaryl-CoA lyase